MRLGQLNKDAKLLVFYRSVLDENSLKLFYMFLLNLFVKTNFCYIQATCSSFSSSVLLVLNRP